MGHSHNQTVQIKFIYTQSELVKERPKFLLIIVDDDCPMIPPRSASYTIISIWKENDNIKQVIKPHYYTTDL